jgi:hypothetical protein
MNPPVIALVLLAVVYCGALVGLWLQKVLPDQHLTTETKEVVRLATALVATLSALVLGLLVSSAKDSFDRYDDELTQNAARVVMLDRTLDEYGPQADAIRALIKSGFARRLELLFSSGAAAKNLVDGALAITREETVDSEILALVPDGPVQRGLQARAVELNGEINMTNALIHAQREDSMPTALLVVLGAWLTLIFATFGLFAPRNTVVAGALLACSLSAAGAVFLILEMHSPFNGFISLSSAPMHEALRYLGQ